MVKKLIDKLEEREVIWKAHPGSQVDFLTCPLFEVLYHGNRGPGKTDALIMSFVSQVGKGYGADWKGILFRRTVPQLREIVHKTLKLLKPSFPTATLVTSPTRIWRFPEGETLHLCYMDSEKDYWNYHGHEYTWIGWEELTSWSTDTMYTRMFTCCRSPHKHIPKMIRATTNPYGAGHGWVSERFNLSGGRWKTTQVIGEKSSSARAAIRGRLEENKTLAISDPNYMERLKESVTSEAMRAAWLDGSWDINFGGIFSEAWNPDKNVVEPFTIPNTWTVFRSFDWGSSAPFSVGWWALSDGTSYTARDGRIQPTIRGDLFRIREWYGARGSHKEGLRMLARDIARGIRQREFNMGFLNRVNPGAADTAIWTEENGNCIAKDMEEEVQLDNKEWTTGAEFLRADKRPGSRVNGWETIRWMLHNAHLSAFERDSNRPGLYIFDTCSEWIRTVPGLERCERNPDDVDTDSEDHIADETRYMVMCINKHPIRTETIIGGY